MLAFGRSLTPTNYWPLSAPGAGVSLTTSLATVSGSQCVLRASDWTAGANAWYRVVGIFGNGLNASDVAEIEVVDGNSLVILLGGTLTMPVGGSTAGCRYQSAWAIMPSGSGQVAAIQVRNQTSARGHLLSAGIEIGYQ